MYNRFCAGQSVACISYNSKQVYIVQKKIKTKGSWVDVIVIPAQYKTLKVWKVVKDAYIIIVKSENCK